MKKYARTPEDTALLEEYGLSPEDCWRQSYQTGETIVEQGAEIRHLYILARGTVRVFTSDSNGRSLVLSYSVSRGLLGDLELLTREHNASAAVVALTAADCLVVPYRVAGAQLKHNTVFLNRLARDLAGKLARSTDSILTLGLRSGEERLCAYLLGNASGGVFRGPLTEAASAVGVSYRHLHRLLDTLIRDGLIRKNPEGCQLMNPGELARRAVRSG